MPPITALAETSGPHASIDATALAAAQRAVADDPGDYRGYYRLATAEWALGETERAQESAAMARRLHALELIADADVDFARLENDPACARELADKFYGMGNIGVASVLYEFALDTDNPAPGTYLQYAL